MKITSIPQIYRNVRRWTEIISVLSKFGLADWISGFKLDVIKDALKARDGKAIARHTRVRKYWTSPSFLVPVS